MFRAVANRYVHIGRGDLNNNRRVDDRATSAEWLVGSASQRTEGKGGRGRRPWSLNKKSLKHIQRTVATAVLDRAGKLLLDRVDKTQLQWAEGTHRDAPRKTKGGLRVRHPKRPLTCRKLQKLQLGVFKKWLILHHSGEM